MSSFSRQFTGDGAAAGTDLKHFFVTRERNRADNILPDTGKMIKNGPALLLADHPVEFLLRVLFCDLKELFLHGVAVGVNVRSFIISQVNGHTANDLPIVFHI